MWRGRGGRRKERLDGSLAVRHEILRVGPKHRLVLQGQSGTQTRTREEGRRKQTREKVVRLTWLSRDGPITVFRTKTPLRPCHPCGPLAGGPPTLAWRPLEKSLKTTQSCPVSTQGDAVHPTTHCGGGVPSSVRKSNLCGPVYADCPSRNLMTEPSVCRHLVTFTHFEFFLMNLILVLESQIPQAFSIW